MRRKREEARPPRGGPSPCGGGLVPPPLFLSLCLEWRLCVRFGGSFAVFSWWRWVFDFKKGEGGKVNERVYVDRRWVVVEDSERQRVIEVRDSPRLLPIAGWSGGRWPQRRVTLSPAYHGEGGRWAPRLANGKLLTPSPVSRGLINGSHWARSTR